VISSFRHEVDENCASLGYYAVNSGHCFPMVGTTYWFCLQGSRTQKESQ